MERRLVRIARDLQEKYELQKNSLEKTKQQFLNKKTRAVSASAHASSPAAKAQAAVRTALRVNQASQVFMSKMGESGKSRTVDS